MQVVELTPISWVRVNITREFKFPILIVCLSLVVVAHWRKSKFFFFWCRNGPQCPSFLIRNERKDKGVEEMSNLKFRDEIGMGLKMQVSTFTGYNRNLGLRFVTSKLKFTIFDDEWFPNHSH